MISDDSREKINPTLYVHRSCQIDGRSPTTGLETFEIHDTLDRGVQETHYVLDPFSTAQVAEPRERHLALPILTRAGFSELPAEG